MLRMRWNGGVCPAQEHLFDVCLVVILPFTKYFSILGGNIAYRLFKKENLLKKDFFLAFGVGRGALFDVLGSKILLSFYWGGGGMFSYSDKIFDPWGPSP